MRAEDAKGGAADRELWRRGCASDAPEPNEHDEAECVLDLAAFVDGGLDDDDRDRIAELIARDRGRAEDVAAAERLARTDVPDATAEIIARACALVDPAPAERGRIIPFPAWRRRQPGLHGMARWASVAAAMVMAGWFGFAMGSDASRAFTRIQANEDAYIGELLNPAASATLRELTESART